MTSSPEFKANPELITFIKKELAKGKTVDAIEQKLLKAGWEKSAIEVALKEAGVTSATSPTPLLPTKKEALSPSPKASTPEPEELEKTPSSDALDVAIKGKSTLNAPQESPYEQVVIIKPDGSSFLDEDSERILAQRSKVKTQQTFKEPRKAEKSLSSIIPETKGVAHPTKIKTAKLIWRIFWVTILILNGADILKKI